MSDCTPDGVTTWPRNFTCCFKKTHFSLFRVSELSIQDGLLMRGSRLVIPRDQHARVLKQLHYSHQGIQRSRDRARQSVWWPELSKELEETVKNCSKIQSPKSPTSPTRQNALTYHGREWEKTNYLLMINYFSRWIEIAKLEQTTSQCVIDHIRSIFAQHGIPETLISDNGPQYSAESFRQFAQEYGFEHITSSPHFPQSNGEEERAVQTVKRSLKIPT